MKKLNLEQTVNEKLKKYSYYEDILKNEDLCNILKACETLNYYINFHRENKELTEELSEIVAELIAEDY